MGIMPIAGNRNLVFHESMYSAMPTSEMFLGSVNVRNAEVKKRDVLGAENRRAIGGQLFDTRHVKIPQTRDERSAHLANLSLQCPFTRAFARESDIRTRIARFGGGSVNFV